MTGWTAIVPIKEPGLRKSRLAALAPSERIALSERMLDHVLDVLGAHPALARVVVLAGVARAGFGWIADQGRGLNAELAAARARIGGSVAVIHADLPLLGQDDVTRLIAAVEPGGCAVAPDHLGAGTNAIAVHGATEFAYAFGDGSLARHRLQLARCTLVERRGLACDVDNARDLGFVDEAFRARRAAVRTGPRREV
jgi:2-phospho-L-lactate guanylyltransferase